MARSRCSVAGRILYPFVAGIADFGTINVSRAALELLITDSVYQTHSVRFTGYVPHVRAPYSYRFSFLFMREPRIDVIQHISYNSSDTGDQSAARDTSFL
jgi:hypothetical protein